MVSQRAGAAKPGVDAATLPISVVIAAYNRADMLRRAIASVRAQRPAVPAEIVVVDDASIDDTAAVAEQLGARVVRHKVNRGESAARNSAIAAAGQPWIAVLDSDDEWLPWHIDTLWRKRGEHVVVAGASLRCAADAAADRVHGSAGRRDLVLRSPADLLFPENVVPGSGVMIRRDVALAAGGYDTEMLRCEDLDLLVRCLERGSGLAVRDVSVIYHLHGDQLSSERDEMKAMHSYVVDRYRDRPWWSRRQAGRWKSVVAWDAFRAAGGAGDAVRAAARPAALARLLWWRYRLRRRSAATDRAELRRRAAA
jgi:glycosyltransferase involved in cell wall biosynthesis